MITRMRVRQTLAVMRQELVRGLRGWASVWLLWLAFAPTLVIMVHAAHDRDHGLQDETLILAGIVQLFYVRFGIFFGCLFLFTRLIRGETTERTLHYLFLAPIRREVVVIGKLLSGALTAMLLFGAGVVASFALMYGHFSAGREFVMHGPALSHLAVYLLATVLACVGYGAVFLAMSLVFKNPFLPAVALLLWEGVNGALPVFLKHLSVTFYLKPLFPVELPVEGISGLFTVVAEPTPPWLAVSGLLVFAGVVLAFACWRIRRIEISYSVD